MQAAPPAPAVLPKEEVIRLSKEYVDKTARELTEESIAMLSDDFVFRGPGVDPLSCPPRRGIMQTCVSKAWHAVAVHAHARCERC